jgi:tetratricopeptide (TPR) repeat protein
MILPLHKEIRLSIMLILVIISMAFVSSDNFYKSAFKPASYSMMKSSVNGLFFSVAGFRTVTADFLWMDIIQYIGDRENSKTQYKELLPKTMRLIEVDPNFTYSYLTISGILMFELKDEEKAIELIKKGIENNPRYWQLNLYLAAYSYKKLGNFKMTVYNIENAVNQEGHPPMLERILGSMYLKMMEVEPANKKFWMGRAVNLWLYMYNKPLEPLNRTYAEQELKKYHIIPE